MIEALAEAVLQAVGELASYLAGRLIIPLFSLGRAPAGESRGTLGAYFVRDQIGRSILCSELVMFIGLLFLGAGGDGVPFRLYDAEVSLPYTEFQTH